MKHQLRGDPPQQTQNDHCAYPAMDILLHWSYVTIFSILGTLTRLGIQALNSYPGQLIPSLVWAQFIGCAIIGFLKHDKTLFPPQKRNEALFIGLTVGYCGSTTSFSAWILAAYQDIANTAGYQHGRGYNVISVLTQIMTTLSASIVAYKLGNHTAQFINHRTRLNAVPTSTRLPSVASLVLLALLFQAGSIIIAALRPEWRGIVGVAMVFSPAGALTRWYLAKWLNSSVPSFPLGTFAANMFGVVLEAIFHLLQYHTYGGNSCAVLQGLQDGYCGALTTVSTFVAELFVLDRQHAYSYAIASIVLGSVLYVLIDGIDFWTHGSSAGYHTLCTFAVP